MKALEVLKNIIERDQGIIDCPSEYGLKDQMLQSSGSIMCLAFDDKENCKACWRIALSHLEDYT